MNQNRLDAERLGEAKAIRDNLNSRSELLELTKQQLATEQSAIAQLNETIKAASGNTRAQGRVSEQIINEAIASRQQAISQLRGLDNAALIGIEPEDVKNAFSRATPEIQARMVQLSEEIKQTAERVHPQIAEKLLGLSDKDEIQRTIEEYRQSLAGLNAPGQLADLDELENSLIKRQELKSMASEQLRVST